ncbi:BlaI/MecI/CopY family transcriptional regulator [Streptomyces sp. NPDC091385]|uniref:BlaI/MecI/CopY family transcriptional regulator n=1 Tax=Streptomyces sp. NPDC091385 TaxID=3365997 RepID=UPI00380F2C32
MTGDGKVMRRCAGALENEVLTALWATDRPLTPAEIQAGIGGLAYNTVHTILKRLYDKGLVLRDADGRRGAYRPAKHPAQLTAELLRRTLDQCPDPIGALARLIPLLRPEETRALRGFLTTDPDGGTGNGRTAVPDGAPEPDATRTRPPGESGSSRTRGAPTA